MEAESSAGAPGAARSRERRRLTETKQAFRTTEFATYVAVLLGIFVAGIVADPDGAAAGGFEADQVWLYATLLTIGYMLSRGLAKSGTRDPYPDEAAGGLGQSTLGERIKAAAQVLTEGPEGVGGDPSTAPTTTHSTSPTAPGTAPESPTQRL